MDNSSTIANAINNFTHVVKEIEFLKNGNEKIHHISNVVQNEEKGKQMMIEGQL